MSNRIAIICPYFGKFPINIELTLYTMFRNQCIDWFIFTDNDDQWSQKYPNIHFYKMTFSDIQKIAHDLFGTTVVSPYKMCDYKPAYGTLFYEYIKEYDFWGYCDLDILFGDLSAFFSDEKLNKFDKIYDFGHLSIYRNTPGVREGFKGTDTYRVPYKDIFNHKYICVFDEYYGNNAGINQVLTKQGFSVYINHNELADIDIKYRNFHIHNHDPYDDYYFVYDDGRLLVKRLHDQEYSLPIAYAHFQQKKNLPVLCIPSAHFAATPKGYVSIEDITTDLFYEKNDLKFMWYIKFRIKRFVNKYRARIWQLRHSDICKYKFDLE